ncbi:hypothetical protein [Flavobacterium beibuense]|uniref:hypothetical protein n=1 Tax=Flavobacterium beibuense TaxID=657326 RepID=UPI003A92449B
MKKFYMFFLLLFGFMTYGQNSYFITQKDEKIIIDDNSFYIYLIDKRVGYRLPGIDWQKYARFKDFKYFVLGEYLFKTFYIDGNKKPSAYYVLAESKNKKLVCIVKTVVKKLSSIDYVTYLILDENDNTILESTFTERLNDENNEKRNEAVKMIKNHFNDCTELVKRLDEYSVSHELITDFFIHPVYFDCKN